VQTPQALYVPAPCSRLPGALGFRPQVFGVVGERIGELDRPALADIQLVRCYSSGDLARCLLTRRQERNHFIDDKIFYC